MKTFFFTTIGAISLIYGGLYLLGGPIEFATLVPDLIELLYAIAGVICVIGIIDLYVDMNNEEAHPRRIILWFLGMETYIIGMAIFLSYHFDGRI